jgi:predicted nucleotidyltransferase
VLPARNDLLAAAIAAGPAARFVALFGSAARGDAHDNSDMDIAWLPVDASLPLADELDFQAELTRKVGRTVDLVRVDRASTLARHEIARDGILLAGDRDAFVRFRADAIAEFLDFEPALRDASERFRRRLLEHPRP